MSYESLCKERTFLICDARDNYIVLNVMPGTDDLLHLLSDGYEAEDLADILRWAVNAELGDVFEGAYICIVRVRDGVEVPVHGEVR